MLANMLTNILLPYRNGEEDSNIAIFLNHHKNLVLVKIFHKTRNNPLKARWTPKLVKI